ncbi:hypothetical protein ABT168_37115, partial [Streptomyces sp. NPDC001793]
LRRLPDVGVAEPTVAGVVAQPRVVGQVPHAFPYAPSGPASAVPPGPPLPGVDPSRADGAPADARSARG